MKVLKRKHSGNELIYSLNAEMGIALVRWY